MKKGELKEIKGDTTDPVQMYDNEISIIPHVCNDENKFGAGFTFALNQKWKQPEQVYRKFCENNKEIPILGKVCYAKISNHLVIANMIAQHSTISKDNPVPIKYVALMNCMLKLVGYIEMIKCQTSNPVVIHAPKFGSQLSGGNFDFVLELIREIWIEAGINVVIYNYVK